MTNVEDIVDLSTRLAEVPENTIIRFHLRPGCLIYYGWKNAETLKVPMFPVSIVMSVDDIHKSATSERHPVDPNIKLKREDFFLPMNPPYEIAGYIDRFEEGSNTVKIYNHRDFRGDHYAPSISLSAVESFEV